MLEPSSLVSLSLLALCIALLVSLRGLLKEVRTFRASFDNSLRGARQSFAAPTSAAQSSQFNTPAVPIHPAASTYPPPQGTPARSPEHVAAVATPATHVADSFAASPSQAATKASAFPPPQGAPQKVIAQEAVGVQTYSSSLPSPQGSPLIATTFPASAHPSVSVVTAPATQSNQAPRAVQASSAAYPPPAPTAPARTKESAESVIGRNVIGIIASALVFIGLIFLGFLVVPLLSDAIRIVLMFVISAAITTSGFVLVRRYPNSFTRILLGTGLGSFFISILLTHLWFHALGDIAAFSLLLVWTIVSLLIARQTKSMLIGIIAHVGMIISVCAGYGAGLSDERLVLLIIYQFISTAVIVVGDILCFKRLYRVGLFVTLLLMLFASTAMWTHFWDGGSSFYSTLPVPLIACAFVVQFVGATILAGLLFVSCIRVADRSMGLLLQAANLVLWLLALLLDITFLVGRLVLTQTGGWSLLSQYDTVPPMLAVSFAVLGAALVLVFVVRRIRDFDRSFEILTVCMLIGAAVVALLVNYSLMYVLIEGTSTTPTGQILTITPLRLTGLLAPALLLLALSRFNYSKLQHLFAAILIGVELLCAFVSSFGEIERFVREHLLQAYSASTGILGLDGIPTSSPLAYLPALAAFVWLAVLLAAAWLCYRLLSAEQRSQRGFRSTFTLSLAIVLEAGVAYVILITPELSDSSFLSLALMFISFVVIMLGFRQRSSSLRIFGLVVVMACVLKLVTFDISGLDTLMRVIAFIGGGLICFGISALYTFAVRRYNDTERLS